MEERMYCRATSIDSGNTSRRKNHKMLGCSLCHILQKVVFPVPSLPVRNKDLPVHFTHLSAVSNISAFSIAKLFNLDALQIYQFFANKSESSSGFILKKQCHWRIIACNK